MSEAATIAILRDLFAIAGLALVLGLGFYALMRAGGGPQWNCDGNVLSRPYNLLDAGIGVLLLGLCYYVSTTTLQTAEAVGPAKAGVEASGEAGLLGGILANLLPALAVLFYMQIRKLEPGEMFGIRQLSIRQAVLLGAGATVLLYAVVHLVNFWVIEKIFHGNKPDNSSQEVVEAFVASGSVLFKLLLALAAVVVAPVAEETIFRGFLYGVTKRFTDRWFAAVFTSVIFACVHRHVGSALPLFTLAMGFSIAYEMTGCLLVPLAMHSIFNAVNLALLTIATRL